MRIALVLTTLLSLAPAAFADVAPTAPPASSGDRPSDDCARARKQNKTCVLDIGPEDIGGTVVKNSGIDTTIATFSKHGSLIHLRKDFIAEIVKTADDL